MGKEFYLVVKPKNETIISGDLIMKIARNESVDFNDYNVGIANDFHHLLYDRKKELVDYLVEYGFSNFVNSGILNEGVLRAGAAQVEVINVLTKYLEKVGVDSELIIVDPFFLAPTRIPNYAELVENILVNFLPTIDIIKIVTTAISTKIDISLFRQIELKLQAHKPSLRIIHTTTNNFHDRFWISNNREKGIVTGTSLNGFGNKIALVDRLNTSDVREIISELLTLGLI